MNTFVNPIPGNFNSFPGYTNPMSHTGYPTPWTGFAPSCGGLPFGGGVPGFNTIPTMPFGYNSPFIGGPIFNGLNNPTGGLFNNIPGLFNGLGTFPGLYNGQTTGSFGVSPWSTPWNTPFNANLGGFSPVGLNNWSTLGQFPGLFNNVAGSNVSTPWNVPFNTIPFNTFPGLYNGLNTIPGYPTNGFNWNGPISNYIPTPGFNGVNGAIPGHNLGGVQNIPFGGMPYGVTPSMFGHFPTPFIGQPWGYMPGYTPMNTTNGVQQGVHGNVPFQSGQGLCREAA